MNGVSTTNIRRGWPATKIMRLAADRPVQERQQNETGDDTILAGVMHRPRIGETRAIAALMPHVLARYGLDEAADNPSAESISLEVLA